MLQKNTLSIKELQDKVIFDFDNILSCFFYRVPVIAYGTSSKNVNPDNKKKQFHKWFEEIENKIEILDLIIHYYRVEGIVY